MDRDLEKLIDYNNYTMFTGHKLIDGSILAGDIENLSKVVKYFKLKKLEVATF